ncbi:MAG: 2-keto-3-deoxy-L-fuconate dehydrogenase, partial [Congregibacter sp.]
MSNPITSDSSDRPVCIVTGGSYGIGDAVCEKFSVQGYIVINLDIKSNITQSKSIEWLECDMSVSCEVKQAIQQTI